MGEFKDLMDRVVNRGEEAQLWDIVMKYVCTIKAREPKFYEEFMCEVEKLAYKISEDEAETIVRGMRPKGQYWSYNQVIECVKSKGITSNWVSWYLVMNMVYNDYYDTAKIYGLQNDTDFFFNLAKNFIEDPDAKSMKVEKYFLG